MGNAEKSSFNLTCILGKVQFRLSRSLKLSDTLIVVPGYVVQIKPVENHPQIFEVSARGLSKQVHYLKLFNNPSREEVCQWIARDECISVLSYPCQPGGSDSYGFPCWSKVLGMP